jgi:hypothetical protein
MARSTFCEGRARINQGKGMSLMSGVLLPYDPQYVGHRQAEKRRHETGEWLRQQELKLSEPSGRAQSPSIVPEHASDPDKI